MNGVAGRVSSNGMSVMASPPMPRSARRRSAACAPSEAGELRPTETTRPISIRRNSRSLDSQVPSRNPTPHPSATRAWPRNAMTAGRRGHVDRADSASIARVRPPRSASRTVLIANGPRTNAPVVPTMPTTATSWSSFRSLLELVDSPRRRDATGGGAAPPGPPGTGTADPGQEQAVAELGDGLLLTVLGQQVRRPGRR